MPTCAAYVYTLASLEWFYSCSAQQQQKDQKKSPVLRTLHQFLVGRLKERLKIKSGTNLFCL